MNPCGRSPNTLFSNPVSTSRSTALTSSQAPIRLSRKLNDPICVPRLAQSVLRKVACELRDANALQAFLQYLAGIESRAPHSYATHRTWWTSLATDTRREGLSG